MCPQGGIHRGYRSHSTVLRAKRQRRKKRDGPSGIMRLRPGQLPVNVWRDGELCPRGGDDHHRTVVVGCQEHLAPLPPTVGTTPEDRHGLGGEVVERHRLLPLRIQHRGVREVARSLEPGGDLVQGRRRTPLRDTLSPLPADVIAGPHLPPSGNQLNDLHRTLHFLQFLVRNWSSFPIMEDDQLPTTKTALIQRAVLV